MAKGEAMTPVPEGNITTTEILVPEVVQEVVPVVKEVVEDSTTLEEASDSTPEQG
jgi:hypothetical protein